MQTVADSLSWNTYLSEVERHINKSITEQEEEKLRQSYDAGYSIHKAIVDAGIV